MAEHLHFGFMTGWTLIGAYFIVLSAGSWQCLKWLDSAARWVRVEVVARRAGRRTRRVGKPEKRARRQHGMASGHPESLTRELGDADESLLAALADDAELEELIDAVIEEHGMGGAG